MSLLLPQEPQLSFWGENNNKKWVRRPWKPTKLYPSCYYHLYAWKPQFLKRHWHQRNEFSDLKNRSNDQCLRVDVFTFKAPPFPLGAIIFISRWYWHQNVHRFWKSTKLYALCEIFVFPFSHKFDHFKLSIKVTVRLNSVTSKHFQMFLTFHSWNSKNLLFSISCWNAETLENIVLQMHVVSQNGEAEVKRE